MTFSFARLGSVRGTVFGSLCLLFGVGCSGDANLGGDQKEQGVGEDGSGGKEEEGPSSAMATGTQTTGFGTGGSEPTSTTGTTGASGGAPASGGTDGQATGGAPATGGSNATGGAPATGGSATGGNTTGGNATGGNATGGNASGGTSATGGGAEETTATGGPPCEMVACFRAIECVESCDGPVLKASCCPCDPGTFDRVDQCPATTGGSGGTGGGEACTSSDDCAEDSYCALADEVCDAEGVAGTCVWRPEVCTAEYAPVCGCDGKTYSNRCGAAAAGVNLVAPEICEEE